MVARDKGLSSDGRNGNGGDVLIGQGGASGTIDLTATSALIADGEGIGDANVAIRLYANNNNISADDTEVHVGHDQTIDSATAGDAGQHHSLTSHEDNKGLIGVMEGKGGDVTVYQKALTEDLTIAANDIVEVLALTANGGNSRSLVGHESSAGKEWQDGEYDTAETGNKLTAGQGGDSKVEDFDDVDGGEADGGTVTVTQGSSQIENDATIFVALSGNVNVQSQNDNVVLTATSTTSGAAETYVEIGHQLKLSAESGEAGVQRGTSLQTAGDGGDINVTRGRIRGDILIWAYGTGTDSEVLIDAVNSLGSDTEVRIGHGDESILTTGRSGFSADYSAENYDGDDGATDSATALTMTIAEALDEIASKTDDQVTDIDERDAKRLIDNTVAALAMARQYKDRMTASQQANLDAAYDAAVAAQTALGVAGTASDIRAAAQAANGAIDQALNGAAGTYGSVAYTTNDGLLDIGAEYALLFADHADGGDITITNGEAGDDFVRISGSVTLGADPQDGTISLSSSGATEGAFIKVGNRLMSLNTTGEGAGEIDGSAPNGGVAGDGGSIYDHNSVSGEVTLTGDEVVLTALSNDIHLGQSAYQTNIAGMADIFNAGLGNGGSITTSQSLAGNVNVTTNHLSDTIGAENSILGAVASTADATMRLGHTGSLENESYSDDRTTSVSNSDSYNRGGDINSTQTATGDVTINLDRDGDNSVSDMSVISSGTATASVLIGHGMVQSAHSGIAEGNDDDGQMVTVTQIVTGDVNFTHVEDLVLATDGSGTKFVNIGHEAQNTGISGDIGPSVYGDDYGERVDADQIVSGAINLTTTRSVAFNNDVVNYGVLQVGHSATQTAKSADDGGDNDTEEGYRDGDDTLLVADVDAYQSVTGVLSITTGEIIATSANQGSVQFGHEAHHIIDTDKDTGSTPGHINAVSNIGDMDGAADITLVADATNIAANSDAAVSQTAVGTFTISHTTAAGTIQFGHDGDTTTGHTETSRINNGSVKSEQIILSDLSVTVDEDLIMKIDANGGTGRIGHVIDELNIAMGTNQAEGHENTYLDALGTTQTSDATQLVRGSVTVSTGDSLSMQTLTGELRIGHASSDDNVAQIGVSDQRLEGDITVTVGTDGDGIADGLAAGDGAAADNDDALLDAVAGGTIGIGHDMTDTANNEVQIASGNIWVEVGADLHVLSAQIGHADYDFADLTVDDGNSYDLAAATALLTPAQTTDLASGTAIGAVHNRIQGHTTIGASQNSSTENSVTTADVMLLQDADINSGYGGQEDADVDGELRFFMPAQENLTIAGTVRLNDSVSSGDVTTVRTADAGNVFEDTGGEDHEHDFTLMSLTADYNDDIIGTGNYAFYFEQSITHNAFGEVYIPLFGFQQTYGVAYANGGASAGRNGVTPLNMGGLNPDTMVGTGSFEVMCEMASGGQNCGGILLSFPSVGGSLSSNAGMGFYSGGDRGLPSLYPAPAGGYYTSMGLEGEGTPAPAAAANEEEGEEEQAAFVPDAPVRILTARAVGIRQTTGSTPQQADTISTGRETITPVSQEPEPVQASLVPPMTATPVVQFEPGYGQSVSPDYDQSRMLLKMGYRSAMAATSSYGIYATGDR